MFFIEAIKTKLDNLFGTESSDNKEGKGVYASISELVKEQYNISGIDFFKTASRAIMAGSSSSLFKGRGMEFDEVRIYQPGDDKRSIDWRVTARRGDTYTKLFKEERERQVIILADMRPNMHFGTRGMFKSVMAARLSAIIAWAGLDVSEKIGGIVVSGKETVVVKPNNTRKNVLSLLTAISKASYIEENTNPKPLSSMLSELRRVAKTGGIAIVISDFHDFDEKAQRNLAAISGKCDVVAINIIDKLEEKAPPSDRYLVTDGNKTLTLFADDYLWREQYEAFFKEKHQKFDEFCKKIKIKNLWVKTWENPANALKKAFMTYKKKRR